jgi:hypothetical protein
MSSRTPEQMRAGLHRAALVAAGAIAYIIAGAN